MERPKAPIQVPLRSGYNAFGMKGEQGPIMRYRLLLFKEDGTRAVFGFNWAYQAHRFARRTRVERETVWYTIERVKNGRVCREYDWCSTPLRNRLLSGFWLDVTYSQAGIFDRPDERVAEAE